MSRQRHQPWVFADVPKRFAMPERGDVGAAGGGGEQPLVGGRPVASSQRPSGDHSSPTRGPALRTGSVRGFRISVRGAGSWAAITRRLPVGANAAASSSRRASSSGLELPP